MRTLFLTVISFFMLLSQNSRKTDSLALVKLYQSTNGANWKTKTNWLSSKPISEWFGIALSNNRVDSINLGSNNLDGSIPEEIGQLSNVDYLSLRINKLSGTIPTTISNMSKLFVLNLRDNELTGSLPVQLATITSLKYIYVYNNNLTELGNFSLASFLAFYVHNNKLSFQDILINRNVITRYDPQKPISDNKNLAVTEGLDFIYLAPLESKSKENHYQWYKNSDKLPGQTSDSLKLSSFKKSDEGEYYCKITHDSLSSLVLETGKITISANKANGPETPYSFSGTSSDTGIKLNWSYNSDPKFRNYYLYIDTFPKPKIRSDSIFNINTKSYTLNNLKPAKTYFIRITAKNTDLDESYFSTELVLTTTLNGYETGLSLNTELIDHEDLGAAYNDIWGFERNGKNFIMISKTFGFAVYELKSDGDAVLRIHENSSNNNLDGWGELRYYKDYVYKCTESGPIKIWKLDFVNDSSIFIKSFGQDAHNISLYKNYLMACGGFYKGVSSWDISNPENPVFKWEYRKNYVHDFVVQDDKLYLAELYASNFAIYDISAVSGTQLTEDYLLMRHHYENGFTHNIWPSKDGKYIVTTDEHDQFDHMQVWNIEDKNNIKNLLKHQEGNTGIVHNAFIMDSLIYASYYTRGLLVYDMTDPKLIVKIGEYDAYPANNNSEFSGTWGAYPYIDNDYIALSNRSSGLDIVKFNKKNRAGSFKIIIMDEPNKESKRDYLINLTDPKMIKYKKDSNHITLKAVPGNERSFELNIPSLNFKKTYYHNFALNSHKTDTIYLNKEVKFATNLSFFQNPLRSEFINVIYHSETGLTGSPILTISNPQNSDTLKMLEKGLSKQQFSAQYRLSVNGKYKFNIVAKTSEHTKTENRTLDIAFIKKSPKQVFTMLDNQIYFDLRGSEMDHGLYFISEYNKEKKEFWISPNIDYDSELKLTFQIPKVYQNKSSLFLYKEEGDKWLELKTYLKGDLATIYTKKLGRFKFDYDFTKENLIIPEKFLLSQNYPNPFNPTTTIVYDIPVDTKVLITIYNVLGQRVRTLVNSFHRAQKGYKVIWDGKNDFGNILSSGVYFYQLSGKEFRKSKKMILIK